MSPPQPAAPAARPHLVFVTGLSGAGKSTAMRALEDLQFACVDNLPLTLIERLLELARRAGGALDRLAAVCDLRDPGGVGQLPGLLDALRGRGHPVELFFLEADDAALSRRFAATGRPHPLQDPATDLATALQRERQALAPLRAEATAILDTTALNVHDLRREVRARLGVTDDDPLSIDLICFAYARGLPAEASVVVDARALATAPEEARAAQVAERLAGLLAFLHPRARAEGRAYLSVGLGSADGAGPAPRLAQAVLARLRARGVPAQQRDAALILR